MSLQEIYKLFLAELANKKTLQAYSDTECDGCGEEIEEGTDFIFLGGEKICQNCQGEIEELLEEQL